LVTPGEIDIGSFLAIIENGNIELSSASLRNWNVGMLEYWNNGLTWQ